VHLGIYYRQEENVVKNPYRWLPRKEEKEKEKKKKSTDRGGASSPSRVQLYFKVHINVLSNVTEMK